MATIVNLPDRQGSIIYSEDDVSETLDALFEAAKGQGVATDDAQETETKARVRARKMIEYLERDHASELANYKIRSHVVPDGDAFLPVLSLRERESENGDGDAA